jgi:RNA-binding protein
VTLTGKQRRFLRSLGHHLEPVVLLGKHGITDQVIAATNEAIDTHELVKVRRGSECPQTAAEVGASLSETLKADLVQKLGHTVLLYRRHPEEPTIAVPGMPPIRKKAETPPPKPTAAAKKRRAKKRAARAARKPAG